MKRVLFFVLTVVFSVRLFAELRTVETKYFFIVYDDAYSEQAAAELANNADTIADEVFEHFCVKKFKHKIPVYLQPHQENLNGYYTIYPYKHIVMYDTLSTDNSISNNRKNLLSVFRHEFTHAVTVRSLLQLSFPLAIREGATVYSESLNGEGRLHDPRVLQMIVQDKIDGTVPKWNELDMCDTYPYATRGYIYGGAFAQFLAEVYGANEYAAFLNMHPKWFSSRNFKLRFDKHIDELFSAFIQTIPVPDTIEKTPLTFKQRTNGLYTALCAHQGNIFVADANENAVYRYRTDTQKKEKLFSWRNQIYHIDVSHDGSFLLLSTFEEQNAQVKSVLYVYDIANKKFLSEKYESLRYAVFSFDAAQIYAVKTTSQHAQLIFLNRKTGEKKILLHVDSQSAYTNIFDIACITEHTIAVVLGNGITRDIFLIHDNGTMQKLELPFQAKGIGNISAAILPDRSGFTFSFIFDNSLTRMAYYDMTHHTVKILDKDISGGAHYPVLVSADKNTQSDEQNEHTFLLTAQHSTHHSLYTISESELRTFEAKAISFQLPSNTVSGAEPTELQSTKYNPIMKLWQPFVLPYLDIGTSVKNTSWGLHFSSHDVIKRLSYQCIIAVMPVPTFAQIDFTGNLMLNGDMLSLQVCDRSFPLTNQWGIRKSGLSLSNEKTIMADKNLLAISFQSTAGMYWYALLDLNRKNIYRQKYHKSVFTADQAISVSQYMIRERLGKKFFAKDSYGFKNTSDLAFAYALKSNIPAFVLQDSFMFTTPVVPFSMKVSASVAYKCRLNPVVSSYIFNGNSCIAAQSYHPIMKEHRAYYRDSDAATTNAALGTELGLQIFSAEIQKSSSWLPLCFNRFNWELGYKALFNFAAKPEQKFLQSLTSTMSITVNGVARIGIVYAHPIRKEAKFGSFDFLLHISF